MGDLKGKMKMRVRQIFSLKKGESEGKSEKIFGRRKLKKFFTKWRKLKKFLDGEMCRLSHSLILF